jgi:hypothetical protein
MSILSGPLAFLCLIQNELELSRDGARIVVEAHAGYGKFKREILVKFTA